MAAPMNTKGLKTLRTRLEVVTMRMRMEMVARIWAATSTEELQILR